MMKASFLLLMMIAAVIVACNKDKFQTKPTLEIRSVSPSEVLFGGQLEMRIDFTDKEGDLSNGELTYIRVRTNALLPPPGNDLVDTFRTLLPEFPVKDRGEINIPFSYNLMDEDPGRNDSMFFRITVKDAAGNQSDTVNTQIVVARQL